MAPPPTRFPAATDTVGTTVPCTQFSFAEGYTGGLFAEYLEVLNPGSSTSNVTVTLVPQGGGSPTVQTYAIPAQSRLSVFLNSIMITQSFAMQVQVTSGPTVVAERIMYFNYNGDTGGTAVVGAQPC